MNVEDAATIRVDEFRRQDAHIPRETNQIDLSRRQRRYYFTIVFCARSSPTFDHQRFNSTFSGSFKTDRGRLITDHDRHFGVGNCLVLHSIRQRNHVRTATRDQDSDALWGRIVGHLFFAAGEDLIQVMLQMDHVVFH